jgi:Rrf2 family protein
MKLTTRGQYGTRALLDVALHRDEEPILLKDIARRQQISLPYLEHLVAPLIAGGMLRSTRGAKGGVSLARPPDDIKLSEVVRLLEGSMALVQCIDDPKACDRSGSCATRDIWGEMKQAIAGVLESTTLQDLAERQKKKTQPEPEMYYI